MRYGILFNLPPHTSTPLPLHTQAYTYLPLHTSTHPLPDISTSHCTGIYLPTTQAAHLFMHVLSCFPSQEGDADFQPSLFRLVV